MNEIRTTMIKEYESIIDCDAFDGPLVTFTFAFAVVSPALCVNTFDADGLVTGRICDIVLPSGVNGNGRGTQ